MSQYNLRKLNRTKFLIIIALIVAIFGLIWFANRSFATITVSPASAKLTIDNAPVVLNRSGVGKKIVSPGMHNVKVEADSFLSISREISFKRGSRSSLSFSLKQKPEVTVIEQNASFLTSGKSANEIFYLDPTGKTLFKATLSLGEGQKIVAAKEAITSSRLSGIRKIIWSPNRDLALFKKDDGVYLFDFQKYDFVHQTETPWGKDIGEVAWAPDNSKIAYFYSPSSGEKSLVFANITNTEITRVANMAEYGIDNPFLSWSPDSDYLILIPRNQIYGTNKIYLYNVSSGSLKQVTDTGDQVDASFSPDGKKIIYATYSIDTAGGDPFVVSIMNIDGSEKRSLGIRTEVDKIRWTADQKNLLISEFNKNSSVETFSVFNIDAKQKTNVMKNFSSKRVENLLLTNEKIMTFQNADGIYAFNVE